jgi:hypothetical protein
VLRSAIRLGALSKAMIDAYVVINLITGVFVAALMAWSISYAVRAFRTSGEWGWALRGDDPPPEIVAIYDEQASRRGKAIDDRDTNPTT